MQAARLERNTSNSSNIESGRKAFPEESTTSHPLAHQLLTAHLWSFRVKMCQRAVLCWPCQSIGLSSCLWSKADTTTEIQSGVEDAAALRPACQLSPSWLSLGAQIVVVGMCWAERT